MKVKLQAYSTALFSTWIFLEELGLLFDCGDGCASHLMQKSRKVKHIFVSHPDRDHLGGLLQFNQLNARGEYPKLYYPADSSSFPFLHEFSSKFDPQITLPEWTAVRENDVIDVHPDYSVKCIRNEHVPSPLTKSLSFILYRKKKKLKAEFSELSSSELTKLKSTTVITELELRPVLAYSADTPVENDGRWQDVPVLIHEATFLKKSELHSGRERNKHSSLEELIPMVKQAGINQLLISHFSSRYSEEEITSDLSRLIEEHELKIPVSLILPGRTFSIELEIE
jgi:ribonuclease Z